jgi:hypothetical protein
MEIEVLGMLGGNYIIIEVDGDAAPVQVPSPEELRDHLRDRGLTERQITKAIEALKPEPRRIRLTVKS